MISKLKGYLVHQAINWDSLNRDQKATFLKLSRYFMAIAELNNMPIWILNEVLCYDLAVHNRLITMDSQACAINYAKYFLSIFHFKCDMWNICSGIKGDIRCLKLPWLMIEVKLNISHPKPQPRTSKFRSIKLAKA